MLCGVFCLYRKFRKVWFKFCATTRLAHVVSQVCGPLYWVICRKAVLFVCSRVNDALGVGLPA
jgi:hypothetical protein